MEKTLRLLMLLSGNRTYSLNEIKERFDISERTVYRYLNQIESSGFVVNRQNGRYRLLHESPNTKVLNQLFHFTEEEAHIFIHSLSQLQISNEAVKKLIKKLHALYDFRALKQLKGSTSIEKVQKLSQAIQNKQSVVLHQYASSNSATVQDRKVEAFKFMADYDAIWCLDLVDKNIKQFKVSRIGHVKILTERWNYQHLHQLPFSDAFRMSAKEPIAKVKAILSLKAYNLIREEYPISKQYLKKMNQQYALDIPIADFHGIGRFVLGLPGDIIVESPQNFKDFLSKMREKYND